MNAKVLAGVALALCIPTGAFSGDMRLQQAQLPPPFDAPRMLPGKQCVPDAQKILKLQRDAFKALQGLSRRDGEKLCASLEGADQLGIQKFLDPKAIEPMLTPQQRELLGAFGIDLSQCRDSQDELDRFATRELNRVEEQLFRCEDRV